jgi:single-stranded-DNA-specific exonuclease
MAPVKTWGTGPSLRLAPRFNAAALATRTWPSPALEKNQDEAASSPSNWSKLNMRRKLEEQRILEEAIAQAESQRTAGLVLHSGSTRASSASWLRASWNVFTVPA